MAPSLTYYDDHVVVHNGGPNNDTLFASLFGHAAFSGPQLPGRHLREFGLRLRPHQILAHHFGGVGHKWVVTYDEPFSTASPNHDEWRQIALWSSIVSGAAGIEFYSRVRISRCEDYTIFCRLYADMRVAEQFLRAKHVPFQRWSHGSTWRPRLVPRPTGVEPTRLSKSGGTTSLTVPDGAYQVQWLDPRNGGALLDGSVD